MHPSSQHKVLGPGVILLFVSPLVRTSSSFACELLNMMTATALVSKTEVEEGKGWKTRLQKPSHRCLTHTHRKLPTGRMGGHQPFPFPHMPVASQHSQPSSRARRRQVSLAKCLLLSTPRSSSLSGVRCGVWCQFPLTPFLRSFIVWIT